MVRGKKNGGVVFGIITSFLIAKGECVLTSGNNIFDFISDHEGIRKDTYPNRWPHCAA